MVAGAIIIQQLSKYTENTWRANSKEIIRSAQFRFELSIDKTENALFQLSNTISDNGTPEGFNETAQRLIEKNPQIKTLQLLPNGIITYIYPFDKSQPIGANILENQYQKTEALKAIELREAVFDGPIELIEGGFAVIGRLPIFKKDTFWGFASALISNSDFEKFVGIDDINYDKYNICITRFDENSKTENEIIGQIPINEHAYADFIFFPEGNWKMYVSRKREFWFYMLQVGLYIGLISLSIIISISTNRILRNSKLLQSNLEKKSFELEKTQKQMEAVFTNSSIAIAFINASQNKWINFSRSFRLFFGYSLNEMNLVKPFDLLHNIDEKGIQWQINLLRNKNKSHFNSEIKLNKKDGSVIWADLVLSPLNVKANDFNEVVVVIEDISLKKKNQLELEKTHDKLTKQNERLLNFAYIVSHNLRKHTSNITGIVNLLKYEMLNPNNQNLIEKLEYSAQALNQTVYNLNDVLNFSFTSTVATENLNLFTEFEKASKLFENEFEVEKAQLILDHSLKVEIPFSRSYLESILYNFISNSFKYSKPWKKTC